MAYLLVRLLVSSVPTYLTHPLKFHTARFAYVSPSLRVIFQAPKTTRIAHYQLKWYEIDLFNSYAYLYLFPKTRGVIELLSKRASDSESAASEQSE